MEPQRIRERLIRYAAGRAYLQAAGLVERLMRDEQTDFLSVTRGLKQLADAGDIAAGQWANGVPFGRVMVKARAAVAPTEVRWREALAGAGLSDSDINALAPCHLAVFDWSEADMVALARGLDALRAERPATHAYNASARYLLGSSKILGMLPARAMRAFGIGFDQLTEPAPDLVVAGAAEPKVVVLIENMHPFETALAACRDLPVALVQTFGFGLSIGSEEWGLSLAKAVEQDHSRLRGLVAFGSPPSVVSLLSHAKVTFWGDLDPAGWAIYARLRARLPQLQLSALYHPMRQALSLHSHPLTFAVGKDGQAGAVKLSGAPAWWPRDRGLDQEFLQPEVVRDSILSSL